jgi:ATP-dependent Clp protease protease subunit
MAEMCQILLLLQKTPNATSTSTSTPGGSITAGMAIYDTMKFVSNDIVTVGTDGGIDGQFCFPVPREALHHSNARVLLHNLRRLRRHSADIQTQANLILDMKHRMAELTAEHRKLSSNTIDGDRDHWFTVTKLSNTALSTMFVSSRATSPVAEEPKNPMPFLQTISNRH